MFCCLLILYYKVKWFFKQKKRKSTKGEDLSIKYSDIIIIKVDIRTEKGKYEHKQSIYG